ncbi:MAG: GrpB family protein [Planctomycetota bacterium]|jgi:GrpB-like predicted nucleotidyltransferase (UPF0157 family)
MSRVIVVDYDPEWPNVFESLRARIWPAVREFATTIEHVGSTSVPGLAAKPNIDMSIIVTDMQQVIARLETIGYRHNGDQGVPGREAFKRPPDTYRHNLYACAPGALHLRNHLAVRDTLRADPARARAYGDLKRRLAARFPDDIDAYIEGKSEFVLRILAESGFQPGELDAIRGVNRGNGRNPGPSAGRFFV